MGRTKLTSALIALVAATALATAGPAVARVDYGVVPQVNPSIKDYKRMHKAGADTVRATLSWAAVDPAAPAGNFDWGSFDYIVRRAASKGVRVLPMLWGSPKWVVHKLEHRHCGSTCVAFGPRKQAALDAWHAFVAAAVERYGRDGTFWKEHRGLRYRPITVWQLWNEQNSRNFYRPHPDPGAYAKLLRASASAIRGQDPSAKILLGGMAQLNGSSQAIPGTKYLKRLYHAGGVKKTFDAVGVHPYAAKAGAMVGVVRNFRRVIVHRHDRGAKLWITETGWSSSTGGNPLEVGARGQANRIRQSFSKLTHMDGRLNLAGIIWYSWRDGRGSACDWCKHSGLVSANGNAKPALKAFRKFAR